MQLLVINFMNTTVVVLLQAGNTTVLSENVFCIFDSRFDALTFPFCRQMCFSLCQSDDENVRTCNSLRTHHRSFQISL